MPSDAAAKDPPEDPRHKKGRAAEDAAVALLRSAGLVVLARNVRCGGGEIDIVARDRETLCFVEVRARAGRAFGGAAASVTPRKQARLAKAAAAYLAAHHRDRAPRCRFDVVVAEGPTGAERLSLIKNAFEVARWPAS